MHESLASDLLRGMKEGKIVFGETVDYEDVKHICGAVYAGELSPNGMGSAQC